MRNRNENLFLILVICLVILGLMWGQLQLNRLNEERMDVLEFHLE